MTLPFMIILYNKKNRLNQKRFNQKRFNQERFNQERFNQERFNQERVNKKFNRNISYILAINENK
tara:strand:- start:305 stop:499 length:195 start_codon:yes stop_codon:yes gene_type:complete